jgi:asparagine synthase (glutamine-hydrolysing)
VPDVVARVRAQHLSYLPESALCDLYDLAREADEQGRPGLLVEAGCALGGSAIVLAAAKAPERRLDVHDVFSMIPAPGERDGADVHARFQRISGGQATGIGGDTYYGYEDDLMTKVAAAFDAFGLPLADNSVTLVRGLFQDTLPPPGAGADPVALAHVDGDWYESVRTCLDRLGPRLAPGGVMVIDDYFKWSGCRTAVDEFLAEHPDTYQRERRTRLLLRRR